MKYKRKPVIRDVVDALKGDAAYTVQRENGALVQVPIEGFERDYEPAKRDYVKKTRIKKAKKATEQP